MPGEDGFEALAPRALDRARLGNDRYTPAIALTAFHADRA